MGRTRSSQVDISDMVYNEKDMDDMIQKVKIYQKDRRLRDIAVDIGYSKNSKNQITGFLKKTHTKENMLCCLKRFQLLFAKLEASGRVFEADHPLQIRVDHLEREVEKLKNENETLEYMLKQKETEIAKLRKDAIDSIAFASEIRSPVVYDKTPVKIEISSQERIFVIDRESKEYRHGLLKNRIRELIAGLQERRRRRRCITYLIVDENGIGMYSGRTIQELKKRLAGHCSPSNMVDSKELKKWIKPRSYLEAYAVFEGSLEECELVEALLINLGPELGFDLLNIRKEKSRTLFSTKFVATDYEDEISVVIESLPMEVGDHGHEELVADIRYMIEKAKEKASVRHYKANLHGRRMSALNMNHIKNKRRALSVENSNESGESAAKHLRFESEKYAENQNEHVEV